MGGEFKCKSRGSCVSDLPLIHIFDEESIVMKHFSTLLRIPLLAALLAAAAFSTTPVTHAHADSVITVTTGTDQVNSDTYCSLREAMINAENNNKSYQECTAGSGNDIIIFNG